ncbi:uncharacterized protein LOC123661246 [Melitaea cinxia]|uniref:uncharacterized protein LOC123661246 n=1 Tax=Melitaea cinxia TaxID=113334 RepID=UPI001E2731A7|nr:uncharacterized protein LOC123661246 [Melitaea cinxia]
MKCDNCNANFTDGVFCNGCKRNMDFSCASISEAGYRKLGPERRASWRCPTCKLASVSPKSTKAPEVAVVEPVTMEMVLSEIRCIKTQLSKLPELLEDVKSIKNEIIELKAACDFNSAKLENLDARVVDIENKVLHIQQSDLNYSNDIALLKRDNINREQWSRMNNVEIKGVPLKTAENLFNIVECIAKVVDYTFPRTQVNYIARVPTHGSKQKSIIVSFINRYIKEEFVAACRARKHITAKDIGFLEDNQLIYINDHLIPEFKKLLTKVKELTKQKGYQYVWVKFCKIHIRRNDKSPVQIISKEADLNKII